MIAATALVHRRRQRAVLHVALTTLTSVALASTPVKVSDSPSGITQYVVPAGGDYAGQSLSRYTVAWWQWAFSIPKADSPLRDTTGKNCALAQSGDVWFLAGAFGGGKVRRTCTVPQGKALFFPVINTLFYARADRPSRCVDNTADAAINNDYLAYAQATLNGIEVPHVEVHRERSPDCFHLWSGENAKAYGSTGYPASTDGYWLMLRPLPPGDHLLTFRAQYNRPDERFGSMTQDIEYRLIVRAQDE
jgi:hypothetical protein